MSYIYGCLMSNYDQCGKVEPEELTAILFAPFLKSVKQEWN